MMSKKAPLFRPSRQGSIKSTRPSSNIQSPSPSDTNLTAQLKILFQQIYDSSTVFLKENAPVISFKEDMHDKLYEANKTFLAFFNVVSRMCSTGPSLKQGRKPGLISGANAIQSAAVPFLKAWRSYSDIIVSIKEKSASLFSNHIQQLFDELLAELDRIGDQNAYNRVVTYNKGFVDSFDDLEGRQTVGAELGSFIMELNAKSKHREKDKTIKLLKNIIDDIEASIVFDSDAMQMYEDYDKFQELLIYYVEKLDLNAGGNLTQQTVTPMKPVITFDIADTAQLFDVIREGERQLPERTPFMVRFFLVLNNSAERYKKEMLDEIELARHSSDNYLNDLTNKINKLQNENEAKEENNKRMQKQIDELQVQIQTLKQECKDINSQNNQPIKQENNVYKDIIIELLGNEISENDIREAFKKYIDSISNIKCTNCETYRSRESDILSLLKPWASQDETDAMKAVLAAHDLLLKNQDLMDEVNLKCAEYEKALKQILAMYTPVDSPELGFAQFVVKIAREELQAHRAQISALNDSKAEQLKSFIERLTKVTGVSASTVDESFRNLQSKIEGTNTFMHETEVRISQIVGVQPPQETTHSSMLATLRQLEAFVGQPQQLSDTNLPEIYSKLQSMTNTVESVPRHAYFKAIIEMLDSLDTQIRTLKKDARMNQSSTMQIRASLEMIYTKLSKCQSPSDCPGKLDSMDADQLMHQIMAILDGMLRSILNGEIFKKSEIEAYFKDILTDGNLVAKSEPRMYIPEICFSYTVMRDSINALQPFADTLDDIFNTFDCRFASFHPGSPAFPKLRGNISKLQDLLNGIAPNRINTVVFHTLSRFVALICSFTGALAALSLGSPTPQNEPADDTIIVTPRTKNAIIDSP